MDYVKHAYQIVDVGTRARVTPWLLALRQYQERAVTPEDVKTWTPIQECALGHRVRELGTRYVDEKAYPIVGCGKSMCPTWLGVIPPTHTRTKEPSIHTSH